MKVMEVRKWRAHTDTHLYLHISVFIHLYICINVYVCLCMYSGYEKPLLEMIFKKEGWNQKVENGTSSVKSRGKSILG